MKKYYVFLFTLFLSPVLSAEEIHVSKAGHDTNKGSTESPLLTIQAAARMAQPGDTITVHEGVYREQINPIRGGASEKHRIIYRAAPGERVEIMNFLATIIPTKT